MGYVNVSLDEPRVFKVPLRYREEEQQSDRELLGIKNSNGFAEVAF